MAEIPLHGRGSLGHGYTDQCGDMCNNAQCRLNLTHDRCTEECAAIVVWDEMGCWQPDAPHLKSANTANFGTGLEGP